MGKWWMRSSPVRCQYRLAGPYLHALRVLHLRHRHRQLAQYSLGANPFPTYHVITSKFSCAEIGCTLEADGQISVDVSLVSPLHALARTRNTA